MSETRRSRRAGVAITLGIVGCCLPLVPLIWGSYIHIDAGLWMAAWLFGTTLGVAIAVGWLASRALWEIRKSAGAVHGKKTALAAIFIGLGAPAFDLAVCDRLADARARCCSDSVISCLRTYSVVQERFRTQAGRYADSLVALSEAGHIDDLFGRAERESPQSTDFGTKRGYFFVLLETTDGSPDVEERCPAICAVPARSHGGGTFARTFLSVGGVIYSKGTGGEPIYNLPADLEGDGWSPID